MSSYDLIGPHVAARIEHRQPSSHSRSRHHSHSRVPFTVPEPDKDREALEEQAIRRAYVPAEFKTITTYGDLARCTECGEPTVDDGNEVFCPNPECVLGREID